MLSELEFKVRKMDREEMSVSTSASLIANALDANYRTVMNYISAKRAGLNSFHERRKKYHKNNEFLTKKFGHYAFGIRYYENKRGFDNGYEYKKHLAERCGFDSYRQLIAFKNGKPIPKVISKRISFVSFYELDRFSLQDDSEEAIFIRDVIGKSLKILDKKNRRIIYSHYFKGKTLEKIGLDFGITKERVRQREARAISKMRNFVTEFLG